MSNITFKTLRTPIIHKSLDLFISGYFVRNQVIDIDHLDFEPKFSEYFSTIVNLNEFTNKEYGSSQLFYTPPTSLLPIRILLVSLGDPSLFDLSKLRHISKLIGRETRKLNIKTSTIYLPTQVSQISPFDFGRIIAEGVSFGDYQYTEYLINNKEQKHSRSYNIVKPFQSQATRLSQGLSHGLNMGKSNNYARTLSNKPGNTFFPKSFALESRKLSKQFADMSCKVYAKKQLESMSMGGILAVARGSTQPPALIELCYNPKTKQSKSKPTFALIGKGITFDSGGISLKPSANMDNMKFDKSGGVAVLATMMAVASLKLNIRVTAYIPTAENMPGGNSYRPGDIITTYSGKTVEITNTDAEGRLLLCDAISYALKEKPDIIIDIATLTGACMVALGSNFAGLMSNDSSLVEDLMQAADLSGEPLWQLPCGDEYAKEMKSQIADLKNSGSRYGGACTAAAFYDNLLTTPNGHISTLLGWMYFMIHMLLPVLLHMDLVYDFSRHTYVSNRRIRVKLYYE